MKFTFVNEVEKDFALPENKAAMENALKKVKSQEGIRCPLIINGKEIFTDDVITSINPSKKAEVIGYAAKGTTEHANQAVESAVKAFETWKYTSVEQRVSYVQKIIKLFQERRMEINAWMIEESGKNWGEADGEVCEAIDFLNADIKSILELDKGLDVLQSSDEKRVCKYIPIGAGVAVTPWNFPFSLMVGMVGGAIITGNTITMKPASDTPIVAYQFMRILQDSGLPNGVVNFLPGSGSVLGEALVKHPKTRFIDFTGSKEVGLHINQMAAEMSEGQIWIKRVIAEMGGKNGIIVDDSADLDQAAEGIVNSAFSFQGQKCSACSRAIVLDKVYDKLVQKLVEKTSELQQGPGCENMPMGPVISQKAYNGIVKYIEIGKKEGKLVCGGTYDDREGFYIQPTIIKDIKPTDRIAQEEIFGPVLAVIKVSNYEEAMQVANGTMYGLTGAVYSKNKEHLEEAAEKFDVGNLYFNRKCTAAVVQQNPFGGFNMSGTDAKTGTKDYLQNFMQLKSVTEFIG
ncbi:L-glutamate gamma-semialdehyde dehydrogenase [Caproicibacterium sp. BJN0003]|uniref:L-glutamate gamma-semialdehyde dehydrogenase n=1 Tax=Caproicibacterium sp. BJN0003 TaxID=2994078 RepID=UPI00225AFAC9|nr:L-glutamate gamma-semialdehyde dehydrogenase [Caproicibacterium sp. BJN0003]UZT81925.1 L-glutamate gamma-semialdehyde dehydrogenase [Caproicibacterium sp. BJN0003]